MKLRLLSFLLSLRSNPVMVAITKGKWGSGMYLDTSHAQNLKEKLLLCAANEFVEYGHEGARVDNIVKTAGCSKQMVYYHFGNKENLSIVVLEYTWNDIREKERELDISGLSPIIAIEKIIDFTWDYYINNSWLSKAVHSENQSKGVHYKKSERLAETNHTHLQSTVSLLEEGQRRKIFKGDIDPLQTNVNIATLGTYYLINQYALGMVYHISMVSPEALETRCRVIKETILSWLLVNPARG